MNASQLIAGQTLIAIDGRKVQGGDMVIGAVEIVSTQASAYGPNGYLRVVPASATRSARYIGRTAEVTVRTP